MEEKRISIHEALPILREVLNMSGFTKLMGKSSSWVYNKNEGRAAEFIQNVGFTDSNIKLITEGLKHVADECENHIILPLSEGAARREHSEYVTRELKELRKLIYLPYLREKHTTISERSFGRKLRGEANGASIYQFTSSDIQQINEGLKSIAALLRSFIITP